MLFGGQKIYLRLPHTLTGDAEYFSQQISIQDDPNNKITDIEAVHLFLSSVLHHNNNISNNTGYTVQENRRLSLLQHIIQHFDDKYTTQNDIHVVAQGTTLQNEVIGDYLLAKELLQKNGYVVWCSLFYTEGGIKRDVLHR